MSDGIEWKQAGSKCSCRMIYAEGARNGREMNFVNFPVCQWDGRVPVPAMKQ